MGLNQTYYMFILFKRSQQTLFHVATQSDSFEDM